MFHYSMKYANPPNDNPFPLEADQILSIQGHFPAFRDVETHRLTKILELYDLFKSKFYCLREISKLSTYIREDIAKCLRAFEALDHPASLTDIPKGYFAIWNLTFLPSLFETV